ncbi:MAG: tRNA uridine-5-carboxymethylaminomethyl(34) synthesis GTPase MnmE, partial [Planctomycetes bacterium]|nr:tRNA uridine-5-carboxymethylaminomethyl(34) synthesis GTPase MnmE [Planctomycetota bacterium]
MASADGAAERAVLRLSGPAARAAAALVFTPALPEERAQVDGSVRVRGHDVAAFALVMCAPRSFTGDDIVELHVPGSPLLCAVLGEDLLARGAGLGLRAALPGEFAARACSNGRLDLAAAEGILMLLHAADRRELARSAAWLVGGTGAAFAELRTGLQDVLALLEAG